MNKGCRMNSGIFTQLLHPLSGHLVSSKKTWQSWLIHVRKKVLLRTCWSLGIDYGERNLFEYNCGNCHLFSACCNKMASQLCHRIRTISCVIDKGPLAVIDKGPLAIIDKGPSAVIDKGPSTVIDKGPSAVIDKGPSAVIGKGPFAYDSAMS